MVSILEWMPAIPPDIWVSTGAQRHYFFHVRTWRRAIPVPNVHRVKTHKRSESLNKRRVWLHLLNWILRKNKCPFLGLALFSAFLGMGIFYFPISGNRYCFLQVLEPSLEQSIAAAKHMLTRWSRKQSYIHRVRISSGSRLNLVPLRREVTAREPTPSLTAFEFQFRERDDVALFKSSTGAFVDKLQCKKFRSSFGLLLLANCKFIAACGRPTYNVFQWLLPNLQKFELRRNKMQSILSCFG
jgi:hypothetical protein